MMAYVFAATTFLSTGLGGLTAIRFRGWLVVLIGFSGGTVIGVSLFDVLPELSANGAITPSLMSVAALGMLSFFVLEWTAELHQSPEHSRRLGIAAAASLSLHSLFDGLAIGVGFQVNPSLGVMIGTAVIAHDACDGLNTVTVMLAHGNRLAASVGWLLVDMSTPFAGVALTRIVSIPRETLPCILAFLFGFFLYLGAGDLLPQARKHGIGGPLAVAAGLAVSYAISFLLR